MSKKNKTIWMSDPLEKIRGKIDKNNNGKSQGRGGGFSRRLGDIAGRYDLILKTTDTPVLTDNEKMILGEVVCGSILGAGSSYGASAITALTYMHSTVLDCASGTPEQRMDLSKKIGTMTPAEKICLIESLGV